MASEASWALWRLTTVGDWVPRATTDLREPLTPQEEEEILAVFRERPGIARDMIDASIIVPNTCRLLEQRLMNMTAGRAPDERRNRDARNRLDFLAELFHLSEWLLFFWPDFGPYLALLSDRARGAGEPEAGSVRMNREFITTVQPDVKETESAYAKRRLELFFDAITKPIEWKSEGGVMLSGTATVSAAPLPDWCDPKDAGRIGEIEPKFLIEVTDREKRLFDILKPYHAHMLPVEGAFLAGSLGFDFGRPGWLKELVARIGRQAFMSPSLWLQIQSLVDEAQGQHVSPNNPASRERVTKAKAELVLLFKQLAKKYRLPKKRTVDRAGIARQHDALPESERPRWRRAEAKKRGILENTVLRYLKEGRVILKGGKEDHR